MNNRNNQEHEKLLAAKNKRIHELERMVKELEAVGHHHPEDALLSLEHRHQAERRRLEERQEEEMKQAEHRVQVNRAKEEGNDDANAIHGGKRHFPEAPYDMHRLF